MEGRSGTRDGGGRRRRLQKAERRRVIEDAASTLFAERGYAATRLQDIAAGAGVTKQLVYQHFRSKKELHLALLAKHRDGVLGRLAVGMSRPGPLPERIARTTDDWFAYVEENPYASAMLFRDTTGDPEIQDFHRELHATARAATAALLRAEPGFDLPEERIEPLAEFIRSATTGLAIWWGEHPEVPRSTVVGVAVDMLMDGLDLERWRQPRQSASR
jgi:AcrR family transcriptional regulator